MNKLKTDINGKFPILLDDFRWIDDGVRDVFKAVFNGYGEDAFIISGCEISTDQGAETLTSTPGYLYFEGEICYCAGGTVSTAQPNVPVFQLEVTYTGIPPGLKLFGDAVQHDTYEIRNVVLAVVDSPATGEYWALNTKRLHELTYTNVKALEGYNADIIALAEQSALLAKKQQEAWTVVTPVGGYNLTGIPDAAKLKYRKDQFGQLQILGSINYTYADPADSVIFFSTPAGYHPIADRNMIGSRNSNLLFYTHNTSGALQNLEGASTGDSFYFNGTIPLD